MQIITYTTKLVFESDDAKQLVIKTLELHRDAVNACLKLHYGTKHNSIVDLHKKFYKNYRSENPELPSQIVIKSEQECLSIYRSIKSNRHKIDTPPIKKKLSLQLDKRLYTWNGETLRITTIDKRVNTKLYTYAKLQCFLGKYKFKDPKIFVRGNDIFVSLPFEIPIDISQPKLALGVDLGIRRFAVTSEGKAFQDKHYLKQKRKLRYLKRCLRSKGTKSAKRHLKKIRHKEHNSTKNFAHHLVNKILDTKANVIVLEDLDCVKLKSKKHHKQNKNRISQVPFGLIKQILSYKAGLVGKQVVLVNPAYTSQIDCVTGKRDGIRQGCRYYSTSGIIYDADYNASLNIAQSTKLPVSRSNTPIWQVDVSQPIVP
jgi:IS605 OrfB family transposase